MATSLDQLCAFADQLGFACKEIENSAGKYLAVNVPTQMPSGGIRPLSVLVRTYDNGELFEAVMSQFLPTELHQKSEHKLPFLFYLLHKAWETKFGTPEVDTDGEVRLLVEFPLIDAEMTVKQFERIVTVLSMQAVEIALEGAEVLKTGKVPARGQNNASSAQDTIENLLPQMLQLATTESGRAKLMAVAKNDELPELVRDIAKKILVELSSAAPDAV